MSILFACPHCHAHKQHHEPIGDKTNVRACPECRRFFYLWWTVKEGRMFGIEPVMSGIYIGYRGTQNESARFATGGFTSDKAWEDETVDGAEFIITDTDKRRALEFIEQLRQSRFVRFT